MPPIVLLKNEDVNLIFQGITILGTYTIIAYGVYIMTNYNN